jgi:hypothetical protein
MSEEFIAQGFWVCAFTLSICVVAAIVNQWRGADRE